VSVILFGSAARRQDTPGSDIDLLVVRPATVPFDDERWAVDVANLSERVSRWCGSPCEVLEYSPDELAELTRVDDPLIESLIRDGIALVGSDIDALLHAATG
jgi:predicted nucleotidyltransferase